MSMDAPRRARPDAPRSSASRRTPRMPIRPSSIAPPRSSNSRALRQSQRRRDGIRPDGLQYIATGDGGTAGIHSQRAESLQSTRQDPATRRPGRRALDVPATQSLRRRSEYGSPRLSTTRTAQPVAHHLHRVTGDLLIADVGQGEPRGGGPRPAGKRGRARFRMGLLCEARSTTAAAATARTSVRSTGREYGRFVTDRKRSGDYWRLCLPGATPFPNSRRLLLHRRVRVETSGAGMVGIGRSLEPGQSRGPDRE